MSDDAELATRRLRLKLALEDLREMKGYGTELVTVIIPPDRQISDARSLLQNEHGQAANIKSKGTSKATTHKDGCYIAVADAENA